MLWVMYVFKVDGTVSVNSIYKHCHNVFNYIDLVRYLEEFSGTGNWTYQMATLDR